MQCFIEKANDEIKGHINSQSESHIEYCPYFLSAHCMALQATKSILSDKKANRVSSSTLRKLDRNYF